jgi:hypothetical protein
LFYLSCFYIIYFIYLWIEHCHFLFRSIKWKIRNNNNLVN